MQRLRLSSFTVPVAVRGLPLVGFCVMYIFSVASFAPWTRGDLTKPYRLDPIFALQLRWVAEKVPVTEKVFVGKVFLDHMFYFRDQVRHRLLRWPTVNRFLELEEAAGKENVRYGVLDIATVANNYVAYRAFYSVDRTAGLRRYRPLPEWVEAMPRDPKLPPFYEILRFHVET